MYTAAECPTRWTRSAFLQLGHLLLIHITGHYVLTMQKHMTKQIRASNTGRVHTCSVLPRTCFLLHNGRIPTASGTVTRLAQDQVHSHSYSQNLISLPCRRRMPHCHSLASGLFEIHCRCTPSVMLPFLSNLGPDAMVVTVDGF